MKRTILACLLIVVLASCALVTNARKQRESRYWKQQLDDIMTDTNTFVEDDYCPQKLARTDVEVAKLLSDMTAVKCLDEKMKILEQFLWNNPQPNNWVLNGKQGFSIISVFKEFIFFHKGVIEMVQPYIKGIYAKELVELLNTVSTFNNNRIKVLDMFKEKVYDVQSDKQIILGAFTDAEQRKLAENILASAKGTNCIFGTVTDDSVVFLIDYSPSMIYYSFQHPNGKIYTRLEYVKIQLVKMLRSLNSSQKFNVIAFDNQQNKLQNTLLPATAENIEATIKLVNDLQPRENGGTNIVEAVKKAFADGSDVIYLLSDGVPTGAIQHQAQVQSAVMGFNRDLRVRKGLKPIKINTISFWLSNAAATPQLTNEKKWAIEVMKLIASGTGGEFKLID
jgi:hypothetical protein